MRPLGWLREITETAAEVELWAGRPEAARELVTDGLAAIAGTDEAVYGSALVALGPACAGRRGGLAA